MGEFEIKRESTGIHGIDKMTTGGFPEGAVIGISGPPGVGKSIFSLHFILEGARKGQKSVYINLEEPRRNIDNMIRQFDFGKEFLEKINPVSGRIHSNFEQARAASGRFGSNGPNLQNIKKDQTYPKPFFLTNLE